MPPTIQLKRGSSTALLGANPFPLVGEIIFEQDTGLFKIGDGIRAWNNLPYANPQSTLTVSIGNVIGLQEALNSKSDVAHIHSIAYVTGLQTALDAKAAIASPTFTGTVGGITKGMVGLGNVDNTSDLNKPISTAVQTALAGKAASTHTHAISEVSGLQAALDGKQASGTYATLVSGLVPSSQLPSYVDDVLEFASLASLPATGESGKIYVTVDTAKIYRWSGSAYVEISPSPGSTDSVMEGSTNLYYTNTRAAAAAPVQSVAGRTGAVTLAKGDVGLGNVDNTSDASKPVSTATQTALDGKVSTSDSRLSDSREWSATTVSQADAEAGTSTSRFAFTPVRVFQAIAAWWAASSAKTKLDGIATNATANSSDATLLARANHTGTQTWSTITSTPTTLLGYGITDAVGSSDARLTDARTPTAHKTSHATGGADALTAADIGAAAASHTHAISDVTNLQTALDSKLPTADINTDLLAGAGIGFSYNSTANALTVYSTNENYIAALGAISGSVALNYDPTTRPIQTMTLGGTATTFTKGTGWPTLSSISVDVVLKITVTTATTVTWSIVNEWYAQPAAGALSIGTHLFLLRAIGSAIEGHYIGSRTN